MSIEGRLESLERKRKDLHDKVEALEAEKAPEKYITPLTAQQEVRRVRHKTKL